MISGDIKKGRRSGKKGGEKGGGKNENDLGEKSHNSKKTSNAASDKRAISHSVGHGAKGHRSRLFS
jgi:hypothetical protein